MAKENSSYYDEIRSQRLQAAYSHRKPLYINGVEVSLNEALKMFRIIEEPTFIQECVKGGRRTLWHRGEGWI